MAKISKIITTEELGKSLAQILKESDSGHIVANQFFSSDLKKALRCANVEASAEELSQALTYAVKQGTIAVGFLDELLIVVL